MLLTLSCQSRGMIIVCISPYSHQIANKSCPNQKIVRTEIFQIYFALIACCVWILHYIFHSNFSVITMSRPWNTDWKCELRLNRRIIQWLLIYSTLLRDMFANGGKTRLLSETCPSKSVHFLALEEALNIWWADKCHHGFFVTWICI